MLTQLNSNKSSTFQRGVKRSAKKVLDKKNKGFSLIEILISVFIIAVVLVNFLGIAAFSLKSARFIKMSNEANFLAKEAIEAVRNFRDGTDWNISGLGSLVAEVDYYPQLTDLNPKSWVMVLGVESVGDFSRKVVFQKVSRDSATGEIEPVYNVFNDDPNTRKVIAAVSFGEKSVGITTYFTNWQQ